MSQLAERFQAPLRHYDEERGRFAREFLRSREIRGQLEEHVHQRSRKASKGLEL